MGPSRRSPWNTSGRPKPSKEYLRIKNEIEAETAVARFLYLVPNYDLFSYIASFFATSRRAIYFGLFPDFLNHLLEMRLHGARPGPLSTLRAVLSELVGRGDGAISICDPPGNC